MAKRWGDDVFCRLKCAAFWGRVSTSGLLVAASAAVAEPPGIVPAELRSASQPLPMIVNVSQEGLRAGRDPADSDDPGGGLVGALVDQGIQSILVGGAQKGIASTQETVRELGPEEVLMASIRQSVASIPWISLASGPALREDSAAAKTEFLNRSESGKVIDAECSYSISQRFNAVYALCGLRIASKTSDASAETPRKERNLLYSRWVEAEIERALPGRSVDERRAQWTNNSGALLRSGLNMALQNVGALVGRELLLTQADIDAARIKPKEHIVDAYVGMAFAHQGWIVDGYDNISDRASPNLGGRIILFKPGAKGVVMLEKPGNLFYTYSIDPAAN